MLTLPWTDVLLYGGCALLGCYALGLATAYAWQRRAVPEVWERRRARELDESRWRDGAPYDGQFRGVRWLPLDGQGDE